MGRSSTLSMKAPRYIFYTGSAVTLRRCHLGNRAYVSNSAHATTRRRGHSRGRPRRGSGQASERKPDEEEARREVDTRARNPENRGNAGLSCIRITYVHLLLTAVPTLAYTPRALHETDTIPSTLRSHSNTALLGTQYTAGKTVLGIGT